MDHENFYEDAWEEKQQIGNPHLGRVVLALAFLCARM